MEFDDTLVNDVLQHADIVKIVGSFLPVIKKGKNYVSKCPFHDDSNPSMTISPEKQIFKCFVCGTGGSAIAFVQKYLHISFGEAMRKVAELSGYNDPRLDKTVVQKRVDPKKEPILKCLRDLTLFYQYALSTEEGKDGLNYFENRHLGADIRDKYKLGYAFKDGKATVQFLQSKGNSLKVIEDTGIAAMMGGSYSDKNQGRVVFPICDGDGNVIGYSARRIVDNGEAKYVNSPETYVFHKSNVLYNFHIAKEKARIANHIYVCEGFMDIFALGKIGVDNAVALMGTALTSEHIQMLRSLNVEIRMCLDGDLAGQTAMLKASKLLTDAGLKCVIVDNNNSPKDPDEIINEDGPEALKLYINKLLNPVDFTLNYYQRTNPLKTNEQKKLLIKEFIPTLLSLKTQLDFDNYIRKISQITGYDVESLRDLVKRTRAQRGETEVNKAMNDFHPERKVLRKLQFAERELLYQMANNIEAVAFYEQNLGSFYDEVYRQLANYLVSYAHECPNFNGTTIIASLERSELDNKEQLINELSSLYVEKSHPQECDKDLLKNLYDSIKSEKERIFEEDTLQESLKDKDPMEQARILSEYNRRKAKKINVQKKEGNK